MPKWFYLHQEQLIKVAEIEKRHVWRKLVVTFAADTAEEVRKDQGRDMKKSTNMLRCDYLNYASSRPPSSVSQK